MIRDDEISNGFDSNANKNVDKDIVNTFVGMEERKSMLDYVLLTEKADAPMKSENYNHLKILSKGKGYALSGCYRFSECENVVVNYKFNPAKMNRKDEDYDVWCTHVDAARD